MDQWGGLDVWVANAGVSPIVADVVDIEPSLWREIFDVNLNGVLFGARAAVGAMTGGGSIIVTGSVLSSRPRRGLVAYAASKAAAIALVKGLAIELANRQIRVNAIAPGWFDSPLADAWRRRPDLSDEVLSHTPLHRWGASEELPGAYLFLASKSASFITGSVVVVDGGYLLG
jgi:NAD(P)-dependent dehydrogenase (short-subunit alcohol dehydrogenase family)